MFGRETVMITGKYAREQPMKVSLQALVNEYCVHLALQQITIVNLLLSVQNKKIPVYK